MTFANEIAWALLDKAIAQTIEQLERVIMRLLDFVVGKQAQTAVEFVRGRLCLFDEVGQNPIAKAVQRVVILQQVLCKIAGFEASVVE